ncbi:uncharacterized protein VTP21DRAFT_6196 [Calcarisporiella thermophila]|uniref:uncharacterized protein n=1 Tax=Calcarisporiella thermophila TaxID=911321 RepID=UPI003743EC77
MTIMNNGNIGSDVNEPITFSAYGSALEKRWQFFLDRITPFTYNRWITTAFLLSLFFLRIILVQGWYIVAYVLGIYLLNLLIAFLSPKFDPALEEMVNGEEEGDGMQLPTRADEEMRPFIRRLPEFKFWYWSTRSILIAFVCTTMRAFDLPVVWQILLFYFIVLFGVTMRRQLQHMARYRYVPWTQKKRPSKNSK